MGKLDGKIALITGGSDGIGLATAQQFLNEGATHVFITGRRQAVLDEAKKKLGEKKVTTVQGDTSNLADLDRLYEVIKQEAGRLDVLFVNAGIFENEPLVSITEEHFDRQFNINVKGLLFTVQKALPLLANGASIILTGSVLSIKGTPACSVYNATKAAVRSFARTWAIELKDRQIRVNTLSPGPTKTAIFNDPKKTEEQVQQTLDFLAASTILGRLGKPEEIATAAVFLASSDSSFITGIELFADGGLGQF